MSFNKLLVVTVSASAGLAWYCRTPSGRQKAAATFNSARHKLADWIKPAAEVEQVIEQGEVVHFDGEEWEGDVPADFLDNIQPTQS